MRRQMTEQQAWEQLYGRRSPDVRVLGSAPAEDDGADRAADRRPHPSAQHDRRNPESEAHAA
jgi:hypothetical protein